MFYLSFYLQCWDECTASTSINKSILDTWSLSVQSMVRDNSLVSTNIAWAATNSPSDCLVTWEVSGGGLIGNLLTQSSNVELSLWPQTTYRIQVTCKNKVSKITKFILQFKNTILWIEVCVCVLNTQCEARLNVHLMFKIAIYTSKHTHRHSLARTHTRNHSMCTTL